jgi:hypothetical protein
MTRRRLALLALTAIAAGTFGTSKAFAAAPPPTCPPASPPVLTQVVSSAHFAVAYTDDPTDPGYISQTQAGNVLAAAERAYAFYTAAGFPPPAVSLPSGKTVFYVMDLSPWKLGAEYGTGCVDLDKSTVTGDQMDFSIGTDVFTQITQLLGGPPLWLTNGVAAWASWRALGYPATSIADIGPFDMTLDCASSSDKANCSQSGYENLGESRWPFYEYLTEKYGPLFVEDIINATNAASGNGVAGLQNALAAKGSSLSAEYGAYAAKLLSRGWSAATLNAATVPFSGSKIQTGISSGAIPSESFGINHLATKFVEIDRGDGQGDHPCYAATLTLRVQIPTGVTSQPSFYWASGGGSPVPLTVSGNTASATVPWDTCAWQTHGYLALPNTSLVDGTSFVVSGTLTVDFSTPATAAVPPAPAAQYGQTFDVSSFSPIPSVSLFGPEVMRLSPTDTQLRLIVSSTGEGSVTASIGSTVLGTAAVSPGGNDLRFSVPGAILRTLRRTAGATTLTLTPVAPDGTTKGTPLTRQVAVVIARPKPKAKVKPKAAKKLEHTT